MKRSIIAKQITKKLLPSFDNADVTVQNLDDLAFSFKTKIDSFTKLTSFDFNLKGKPRIVWDVDPVKLKTSLVDQPRKNLSTVLSTFKGIEKAEASILPFWKSYFPGTVSKITVENVSSL